MLVITPVCLVGRQLGYYHDYGVHKQCISETVAWVECSLIKNGTFSLPSKRELINSNTEIVIFKQTKMSHNKWSKW